MNIVPFYHPIERGLILVAQPEYMSPSDVFLIRGKIHSIAPDIKVMIVGRSDRADLISREFWNRPILTVSFGPMGRFNPLRGKVLQNRPIPKLHQYARLKNYDVMTPRTAKFDFGMALPIQEWGNFCILKPADLNITSSGRGIYLYRSERLERLVLDALPRQHMAASNPMIVQSFIDTGPRFTVYRCLTLFGERIYQNKTQSPENHPPLHSNDAIIESIVPEPPRSKSIPEINADPDIAIFAKKISEAFSEIPLLGCDILKEEKSGNLYAIEVNAGGNVWHLSSPRTEKTRSATKTQLYVKAFKPFDVAARSLVRAVRRYAS